MFAVAPSQIATILKKKGKRSDCFGYVRHKCSDCLILPYVGLAAKAKKRFRFDLIFPPHVGKKKKGKATCRLHSTNAAILRMDST
jgi:hypothetical protein